MNAKYSAVLRKTLRFVAGWSLIVVGIVGLFLPLLQGVVFIILGVIVLAPESPRIQRLRDKMETRAPHLFNKTLLFRQRNHEQ